MPLIAIHLDLEKSYSADFLLNLANQLYFLKKEDYHIVLLTPLRSDIDKAQAFISQLPSELIDAVTPRPYPQDGLVPALYYDANLPSDINPILNQLNKYGSDFGYSDFGYNVKDKIHAIPPEDVHHFDYDPHNVLIARKEGYQGAYYGSEDELLSSLSTLCYRATAKKVTLPEYEYHRATDMLQQCDLASSLELNKQNNQILVPPASTFSSQQYNPLFTPAPVVNPKLNPLCKMHERFINTQIGQGNRKKQYADFITLCIALLNARELNKNSNAAERNAAYIQTLQNLPYQEEKGFLGKTLEYSASRSNLTTATPPQLAKYVDEYARFLQQEKSRATPNNKRFNDIYDAIYSDNIPQNLKQYRK